MLIYEFTDRSVSAQWISKVGKEIERLSYGFLIYSPPLQEYFCLKNEHPRAETVFLLAFRWGRYNNTLNSI